MQSTQWVTAYCALTMSGQCQARFNSRQPNADGRLWGVTSSSSPPGAGGAARTCMDGVGFRLTGRVVQEAGAAGQVVEAGVLTNLPYASNTFDLVFSSDVLEHIHEDEVRALDRLQPAARCACALAVTCSAVIIRHAQPPVHIIGVLERRRCASPTIRRCKVPRCMGHVLHVPVTGQLRGRCDADQSAPDYPLYALRRAVICISHSTTQLKPTTYRRTQMHHQAGCLSEMLCSVHFWSRQLL